MKEILLFVLLFTSFLSLALTFTPNTLSQGVKKQVTRLSAKFVVSISSDEEMETESRKQNVETKLASSLDDWKVPPILPKLLVFDLDNTIWTPELYQIRQPRCPLADRDITLFSDVRTLLEYLHENKASEIGRIPLAIASRTNKGQWARQLLKDFKVEDASLGSMMDAVEIETGSKKVHMANLKKSTGVSYQEMIFFDDDMRLNLREISQLGLLCGHCPKGLTIDLFKKTLERYNELHSSSDKPWMGEIIKAHEVASDGSITTGKVDYFNPTKRFGFVKDSQGESYFFHESKVAQGVQVRKGSNVEFECMVDSQGRNAAAILRNTDDSMTGSKANAKQVTMPCFTMSQPFASLLLNGIKTIESRNNDMFTALSPGTKVLLHAGRRDWHDQETYKDILAKDVEFDNEEIKKVSQLQKGFQKGQVLGVITVGDTYQVSSRDKKMDSKLQRSVLAYGDGIGTYCTEIVSAQWLSRGVSVRGQPGIYSATIDEKFLPKQ
mmetsp:Transcript_13759/g.20972  ORF Transcript_13759/g.20972 Transcript_13759/m.20972 type:complete len:495 (-) Transcript_13759:67-1551(-)